MKNLVLTMVPEMGDPPPFQDSSNPAAQTARPRDRQTDGSCGWMYGLTGQAVAWVGAVWAGGQVNEILKWGGGPPFQEPSSERHFDSDLQL